MEERIEKQNDSENKDSNNLKKNTKWKKVLIIIACLIAITGAANVYATTNGFGNAFFLIKYLVTGDKEVIAGKDAILSDRDITISYETIKLTENVGMQIRNFKAKDNDAVLTIAINEEVLEKYTNIVPLRYKVYDSFNNLLCNQRSVKAKNQYLSEYTEELVLNNYKQEDNSLILEVYNSNDEKLVKIKINLNTREIIIEGEKEALQKISEIELKNYLSVISSYERWTNKNESYSKIVLLKRLEKKLGKDIITLKDNSQNGLIFDANEVNNMLKSLGYEEISNLINGEFYQTININGKQCYKEISEPQIIDKNNIIIEIKDISFCAGLYNATFTYLTDIDNSFETDHSKYETQEDTIYFKVNEDKKYSAFKVIKYLMKKNEMNPIQDNNSTITENTLNSEPSEETANNANTTTINTNAENSTNDTTSNNVSEIDVDSPYKKISREYGQWQYYTSYKNDIQNRIYKQVSFEEIFGDDYSKNVGRLAFTEDGKFSGNLPMVNNEHIGTYTINGNEVILNFQNDTIKLEYVQNEDTNSEAIRQIYGKYEIILRRNGYKPN